MSDKTNPHAIDVESADYMHTSYENDPGLGLPKFGEWISVEDSLPNCIGILAYTGGIKIVLNLIENIYYSQDGNRWCNEVTHWMPLPEKPD